MINKVFLIKEPAQEFSKSPKIIESGNDIILGFDYEGKTGKYLWTGIMFANTIDWKHTKESELKEYMLQSYNCISVIDDSKWLTNYNNEKTLYKHYLIYFDGYGAYEFISQDFKTDIDFQSFLKSTEQ